MTITSPLLTTLAASDFSKMQRGQVRQAGVDARNDLEHQAARVLSGDDPGHVGPGDGPRLVSHRLQRFGPGRRTRKQGGDLGRRPQPALPASGLLGQPGVLDGHTGGGGQRHDHVLIMLA